MWPFHYRFYMLMIPICLNLGKILTNLLTISTPSLTIYVTGLMPWNVSKTHFLIWAPQATMMNPLKPIVIRGHEIDNVCNTKFLGIVLDDRLNWKSHSQYIKKTGIGILKKLRPYINISTMVSLYYSFIYPYLMYCVHVCGKTYASNLDCLNKLQKRIIRLGWCTA